jgi:D-alanine-D-alanine ligase
MKKKILLIQGGSSNEREISLRSGKACQKALRQLGFKVIVFDPFKDKLIKIKNLKVDKIFNALHGRDGEDGIVQGYFEYFKIPYTHSGITSSMNAMDKIFSKKIFIKNDLKTPNFISLNAITYLDFIKKKNFKKSNLHFPVVVKPSNEGSSVGVEICKTLNQLNYSIIKLIKKFKTLIIEEFVGGQEIQVAVINGKALGAIELKPKRKFYDYKAKYSKSAKTEHIMPANLKENKYNEVLELALKAHKALNCKGVTRSDFKFVNNKFYILEINTQPGMTNLSLVPEIAKFYGITFLNLVKNILNDASTNR